MSDSTHGTYSFYGKNILCTLQSYEVESVGRFGRMFRDLPPLYTQPAYLSELGKAAGPMDAGSQKELTDTPLGMIFFGQFIDHDITFDTASNFANINNPSVIENSRTATLDLDCVFGEGPEDEPFLYVMEPKDLKLLTGSTNNNIGQGQQLEKSDLARTGQGRAIIGDPRNDENRIISQFQLLMIKFYNAVYEEEANKIKAQNSSLPASAVASAAYKSARELVTWHYQWIVLNEFLPLLCGQPGIDKILGEGRQFYKPCHHPFIPVEFSVAAYRFGHSMIAQKIKLQKNKPEHNIFSQAIGFGFSKITDKDQVVQWDQFFNVSGDFQKAEQLDTKLASDLLNLPFIPSANPDDKSLATRNLRRGQSFLLPSGESVARCIKRPEPEISAVQALIKNATNGYNINLNAGTPLWYYILAEAEAIGRIDYDNNKPGEGLGPVGATIVAEVLIGLMELDQNAFLGRNRDWRPTLTGNGQFTMKDLIAKAATAP